MNQKQVMETKQEEFTKIPEIKHDQAGYSVSPALIQSRILVAQKIQRNQDDLLQRLKEFFKNDLIRAFYESSDKVIYAVPRKGKKGIEYISGLGVQAIKDIASMYKHMDFGVDVLSFNGKQSADCVAWALDLQQNICEKRQFRVFFPSRLRDVKNFSDEAYKIIYSEGARRMRSCIERLLPLWLTEAFKTKIDDLKRQAFAPPQAKQHNKPKNRPKPWIEKFKEMNDKITQEDLDLVCKSGDTQPNTPEAFVHLSKVYSAIKHNDTTLRDVFPWVITKENTEPKTDIKQVRKNLI